MSDHKDAGPGERSVYDRTGLPEVAAIARMGAGDGLVERISEPHDPGDFVGDIFYGHPVKTTMGTHRWTGTEWVALPSEAEALAGLLAGARKEAAALRERVARLEGALVEHNDLLRSALSIAKREGVDGEIASTNWDAYYNRVAVVLKRHHQTANDARAALTDGGSNG